MKKAADEKSPGHGEVGRDESRRRCQRRAAVATRDLAAEGLQHALSVIARDRRLDHRRGTVRVEPGEEQRRLDLRARDFGGHTPPGEPRPARDAHRRATAIGLDPCPERAQGLRGALHRPPHQGFVADEHAVERLRRKQAHEEPHGRTRIAHVERRGGRAQAVQPDAVDLHATRSRPTHGDAHALDRAERREAILTLEETLDPGRARRDRTQHQCPMRDRLVARYDEAPGHALRRNDVEPAHARFRAPRADTSPAPGRAKPAAFSSASAVASGSCSACPSKSMKNT